jgi:hypothetical protein
MRRCGSSREEKTSGTAQPFTAGHPYAAGPRDRQGRCRPRRASGYLDGELCGIGPGGIPSFNIVQLASDRADAASLVFFLFDISPPRRRGSASAAAYRAPRAARTRREAKSWRNRWFARLAAGGRRIRTRGPGRRVNSSSRAFLDGFGFGQARLHQLQSYGTLE